MLMNFGRSRSSVRITSAKISATAVGKVLGLLLASV
jgi:hypothetical protein